MLAVTRSQGRAPRQLKGDGCDLGHTMDVDVRPASPARCPAADAPHAVAGDHGPSVQVATPIWHEEIWLSTAVLQAIRTGRIPPELPARVQAQVETDLKHYTAVFEAGQSTPTCIFREVESGMGVLQRREVPAPSLRLGLVVEAHQFGHFGGRKTSARLRDMGLWWLGMDKDVDVVVQRCGACLRDAAHRTIHHPARSIPIPAGVFDRVHMDLMLMPESSGGYVQLLLFVDALSKYPIAFPLRSKEASLVAERLWHVICTFGTPVCLHSDNGTEFVNEVVDTLSALHGIQRRTITAFRPQANGQVERVNRPVLDVLRKYCGTFPDRWPDWLDFVMLAIRTATHSSTGQTPFEVMFGRPFNPLADYCALNFTRFTPDPGD